MISFWYQLIYLLPSNDVRIWKWHEIDANLISLCYLGKCLFPSFQPSRLSLFPIAPLCRFPLFCNPPSYISVFVLSWFFTWFIGLFLLSCTQGKGSSTRQNSTPTGGRLNSDRVDLTPTKRDFHPTMRFSLDNAAKCLIAMGSRAFLVMSS